MDAFPWPISMWLSVATMLTAYLAACARLRYRQSHRIAKMHSYLDRKSFAKMTANDAHAILTILAEQEFPSTISASVFFALFKTYGIPSISTLLCATGEIAGPLTSSKRAADTEALLREIVLNEPTSARAIEAISRMNYLHSGYRKAGKILDDDMLYTLSLFALEPGRWTHRYEWRDLTEVEQCAMGTFWKGLGDAMEISYNRLSSNEHGWRDGLQWLEELEEWSRTHEEANMVPAVDNQRLALATVDLLLWNLPRKWKGTATKFVAALLEPRLRVAMMLPEPEPKYYRILHTLIGVRKFILRHLLLPRPYFLRKKYIPASSNPHTGRFNVRKYRGHPWYVLPSRSNRWGINAWQTWLTGGKLPGDDGDKYHPEGYAITKVGPEEKKDKGEKEMIVIQARLTSADRGGCPFGTLAS